MRYMRKRISRRCKKEPKPTKNEKHQMWAGVPLEKLFWRDEIEKFETALKGETRRWAWMEKVYRGEDCE